MAPTNRLNFTEVKMRSNMRSIVRQLHAMRGGRRSFAGGRLHP
jgi:hypothetical protein